MSAFSIKGLATAAVYVADYQEALTFYQSTLGFKKMREMGPAACWGKLGELPLFIESGNAPRAVEKTNARVSFVLEVDDVASFHRQAKTGGYAIDQDLQSLGDGKTYWFLFRDPAGNILEAAGEIGAQNV